MMKPVLQFIGDLASVLMIPLAAWGWFTIKQEIQVSRLQSEREVSSQYVLKTDYTESIRALAATDQRIIDLVQADKLSLQHLTDLFGTKRDNIH